MNDLAALEARLAASEDALGDVRPHARKRIVWANGPSKTALVVVYVHGFSANAEEIRPVPDRVAERLGANLFFTRLSGHGRPGPAMGEATLALWMADMAEAMEVARALGDRILIIACSTGATLTTLAAADPALREGMAGAVFVSPNFGLRHPAGRLLQWPGARRWVPWIVGKERSFAPRSDDHARFWTLQYPTKAVFPMLDTVAAALALDVGKIDLPALFLFSDKDQVVNPSVTRRVAAAWGGLATLSPQVLGDDDDPNAHVIAGDVLSPSRTADTVEEIVAWVAKL